MNTATSKYLLASMRHSFISGLKLKEDFTYTISPAAGKKTGIVKTVSGSLEVCSSLETRCTRVSSRSNIKSFLTPGLVNGKQTFLYFKEASEGLSKVLNRLKDWKILLVSSLEALIFGVVGSYGYSLVLKAVIDASKAVSMNNEELSIPASAFVSFSARFKFLSAKTIK